MRFSPACLLALFLVAGCSTAQLNSDGAKVAASRNPPPPGCTTLGYITGAGGGSFGGGLVSNDQLVSYALNDLRNNAAKLGANYIQHDPPQLGSASGTTSTATITGTAFKCAEIAPVQATQQVPVPAQSPLPKAQ